VPAGSLGTLRHVGAVFETMAEGGHEQVVWCHDAGSGLRAIIAIHSTALGPALGGARYRPYASEDDALVDVLRLSRGMTYKNAAAGLDLGGGKAVIIGNPADRTEARIRAFGRFVHALAGRYLTAEDVGTTQADMDLIRRETPYVTGVSMSLGGSGDPSPVTAVGVRHAMHATAEHLWGDASLAGRHVAISGVGKVGSALAGLLVEEGARVTVADVDEARVKALLDDLGVAAVPADVVHTVECDVFAPCAYGAVLSERTIPGLRCAAVVGAANNQLAVDADADRLAAAGVLYVPDFVANAGGVINIAEELHGYDAGRAMAAVARIRATTASVLSMAAAEGIRTEAAAERLAEARIAAVSAVRRIRLPDTEHH
jgi:glutamate dehydrogenase/leucine dehydrogenase